MAAPKSEGRMIRKCLTVAQHRSIQGKEKVCPFCKERGLIPNPKFNPFEVDHVTPVSLGGNNDPDNLRWVCMYHNIAKRNTPDGDARFSRGAGSKYFERVGA